MNSSAQFSFSPVLPQLSYLLLFILYLFNYHLVSSFCGMFLWQALCYEFSRKVKQWEKGFHSSSLLQNWTKYDKNLYNVAYCDEIQSFYWWIFFQMNPQKCGELQAIFRQYCVSYILRSGLKPTLDKPRCWPSSFARHLQLKFLQTRTTVRREITASFWIFTAPGYFWISSCFKPPLYFWNQNIHVS